MNLTAFEREILTHARCVLENHALRKTDIHEWAVGEVRPCADDVAIQLQMLGCNICVPKSKDRRATQLMPSANPALSTAPSSDR